MKTIERYVFGSFLSSFILAFVVLSFVLTIGLLVQIVGFIMDGVPLDLVPNSVWSRYQRRFNGRFRWRCS